MKKFFNLLLTIMFLFVALEGFALTAAAEDGISLSFDVNAVEYEDEEQIDDTETAGSDLITETEAEKLAETQAAVEAAPIQTVNPGTGVIIAIIPAAIALAVLIALWLLKKKGKGNKRR